MFIACIHFFDGNDWRYMLWLQRCLWRFFFSLARLFGSSICLKFFNFFSEQKMFSLNVWIFAGCCFFFSLSVHNAHDDIPFQQFYSLEQYSLARFLSVSANCIICQVSSWYTAQKTAHQHLHRIKGSQLRDRERENRVWQTVWERKKKNEMLHQRKSIWAMSIAWIDEKASEKKKIHEKDKFTHDQKYQKSLLCLYFFFFRFEC